MRVSRLIVVAGLALLTTACGAATPAQSSRVDGTTVRDVQASDFSSARFDRSTEIDNEWLPLEPGAQFTYTGSSLEDGERLYHRVVFTVTDLTKPIQGIETVVVWDRDYVAGELVEAELAFFAQDNAGNIWHLGEYPEEYNEGRLDAAPTWIAGLKGARAGVLMRAQPRLGSTDYAEGYAPPPINWVDRGRVHKVGESICVPAGCFDDVLVIEEFEPDKPDAYQLKYYAPGVGLIHVGWRGAKEDSRETLELVRLVHLDPEALARARAAALALQDHGYKISKDVYARTLPAS